MVEDNSDAEVIKKEFTIAGQKMELFFRPEKTFMPNPTTNAIYGSVQINPGEFGIEIGAGAGPGSILMGKNPQLGRLYAVEFVPEQFELLQRNVALHSLESKVFPLNGSIFEPIKQANVKADFIVSDVSGMNEVGVDLRWYPPNVPRGGLDGTDNIVPLLKEARNYLNLENPNARVYFPIVVQFSDKHKILNAAAEGFETVRELTEYSRDIPLMASQLAIIDTWTAKSPENKLYAEIPRRGSRGNWRLEVYEASRPRSF